jgi:hypothetical protein
MNKTYWYLGIVIAVLFVLAYLALASGETELRFMFDAVTFTPLGVACIVLLLPSPVIFLGTLFGSRNLYILTVSGIATLVLTPFLLTMLFGLIIGFAFLGG